MASRRLPFRRLQPMVLAIMATLCAAGLVLYHQHGAASALQSQTQVIVRQVSERTAIDIAAEVHRTLGGPVFDTLTVVNHPELRAGRLDLVARQFADGLEEYPHIDRFFVWNAQTEARAPGEALFFGRPDAGDAPAPVVFDGLSEDDRFVRDPALGRAIMALARHHGRAQQIYVAAENVGPGRYQVLIRLFFVDAQRLQYFAALGFVVDPEALPQQLFGERHSERLSAVLRQGGANLPLRLRITDEHGAVIFGDPTPPLVAAQITFPMQFYPGSEIQSRLAAGIAPRLWTIEVGTDAGGTGLRGAAETYWPTVFSVLLMLVAVGLTLVANRRAEELTRMQADFISNVSHQLKTPLSLISAATETVEMARVSSPEKLSQYLGIIRSEVTRLSALVQRILEFSRLQQQRGYEFELVDLCALVRETVEAFEKSLSAQHFHFRVEQGTGGLAVLADPAAIEQALANLLDNAINYSGDARDVTVRVWSSGAEARIEVVDAGPGISVEDREHIFDKFYRGSAASHLHRKGFGLGLPIAQELVRAHRGRVEVESMIGHGSTFRIVLPRARSERAGGPVLPASRATGAPQVTP